MDDPTFAPGTIALVTGAASGIGRATALALAANGLTVVGADVDTDGVAATAAFDGPGEVRSVPTDLTVERDVETMVEAGRLRCVANVAGLRHVAPLPAFPTGRYDELLDVTLRAPFLTAKAATPAVRARDGRGAIGNVCSVHGRYAARDEAAYITAKHGLRGLTRSIAAEGDGTLRGFSVSVGSVLTPLMIERIADNAVSRNGR